LIEDTERDNTSQHRNTCVKFMRHQQTIYFSNARAS